MVRLLLLHIDWVDCWYTSRSRIIRKGVIGVKKKVGREKEYTIRGVIFPTDWDEDDNIVAVVIDTEDEDEYFVSQNKKGRELCALVGKKIEVTGVVSEEQDGNRVLDVKRYNIIGGDEDEDE